MNKYKKIKILLLFSIIGTLLSLPAFAIEFSTKEKQKLKSGKTVVRLLSKSGKKGFYAGASYVLINEPVDKVWKTLQNWGKYRYMFSHVEVCKPISRKANKTLLKMKIGHPVVSINYHVQIVADYDKKTLRFDLAPQYPHDIDSLTGYWKLFPQKGGRTLAAYVVSVKAPIGIVAIAGDLLVDSAIRALLHIPSDVKKWLYKHRK